MRYKPREPRSAGADLIDFDQVASMEREKQEGYF